MLTMGRDRVDHLCRIDRKKFLFARMGSRTLGTHDRYPIQSHVGRDNNNYSTSSDPIMMGSTKQIDERELVQVREDLRRLS